MLQQTIGTADLFTGLDSAELAEAMDIQYVNGLLQARVMKDHLAKLLRLTVRFQSWLSTGQTDADAATAKNLVEMAQTLQASLSQISQHLDSVQKALIQANPETAEFLDEFYLAWRVGAVFNPSVKGDLCELHTLPKQAELSVRWYEKALQWESTWSAQAQLSSQRQHALATVHLGLWLLATTGQASRTQRHNQRQRAKLHLVQAANLGLASAMDILAAMNKTGDEPAKQRPNDE